MGTSLLSNLEQALLLARQTGQPVPLGVGGAIAMPNGSIGQGGTSFAPSIDVGGTSGAPIGQPGSQFTPVGATQQSGVQGGNAATPVNAFGIPAASVNPAIGLTPSLSAQAAAYRQRTQPVLNQANPVTAAAGVPGLPGSPSGAAVMPPAAGAPTPAAAAPGGLTTDQLNALSLQAAQAGRTYWNPSWQYTPGQPVTNALTLPPGTSQAGGVTAGNALVPQQGGWTSAAQQPVFQQQLGQLNAYRQWQGQQAALQSMYGGGAGP